MPWPLSQDYNEAIQTPTQCFNDPELQRGEAVTNELGLPMPCSGNFADVYAVQAGQQKWAIKCFTRQIQGLRERYAEISKYLQQVQLPFMVDFKFLPQGIRVRGQWYPILKMQWVEGLALNAFVKGQLDNPSILRTTSQLWARMGTVLREANLAHGDLQHGNVLLVPGSQGKVAIKLVDYDGMCVPALEFLKATEVGHPAYQHPQRLREGTFGLHIDRFSHLVIYTALRALAVGGRKLWERYDNGDNLLFSQKDFENPQRALIFQELLKLADPEVNKLVQALAAACQKPVDQTPLLEDLLSSGSRSKTAIPKQSVPPPAEPSPFVPPSTPTRPRKKQGGKGVAAAVLVGCLMLAGVAVGACVVWSPPPPPTTPTPVVRLPTTPIPTQTTAPSKCTLALEIEPEQAEVQLDGKLVNFVSPKDLSLEVSAGKHELKVSKSGFKPYLQTVDVSGLTMKRFKVTLERDAPQPSPWDHLDISNATATDGFLRLSGGNGRVQTKASYSGPLEITVVARTNEADARKQNIRINAYDRSLVIFNWEVNPRQLRIHRPDGAIGVAAVQPLAPNTWYTLKWRFTPKAVQVFVNDKMVASESSNTSNVRIRINGKEVAQDFNLSANRPVSVTNAFGSEVDVSEFRVQRQ